MMYNLFTMILKTISYIRDSLQSTVYSLQSTVYSLQSTVTNNNLFVSSLFFINRYLSYKAVYLFVLHSRKLIYQIIGYSSRYNFLLIKL